MKIKLSVWDNNIKFPELCCVTGQADPTIEKRPIFSTFFLMSTLQSTDYLPMSREGWKKYSDSRTAIDRFDESLSKICLSIPILGGVFYLLYFLYFCLPLALINFFIKRSKKRCRVSMKKEGVAPFMRGAIIEIPSEEFGKQFIELNKDADATEI